MAFTFSFAAVALALAFSLNANNFPFFQLCCFHGFYLLFCRCRPGFGLFPQCQQLSFFPTLLLSWLLPSLLPLSPWLWPFPSMPTTFLFSNFAAFMAFTFSFAAVALALAFSLNANNFPFL